jgi:hypothetical protein
VVHAFCGSAFPFSAYPSIQLDQGSLKFSLKAYVGIGGSIRSSISLSDHLTFSRPSVHTQGLQTGKSIDPSAFSHLQNTTEQCLLQLLSAWLLLLNLSLRWPDIIKGHFYGDIFAELTEGLRHTTNESLKVE